MVANRIGGHSNPLDDRERRTYMAYIYTPTVQPAAAAAGAASYILVTQADMQTHLSVNRTMENWK